VRPAAVTLGYGASRRIRLRGTWGDAGVNRRAFAAEGCTTCGLSGGGAGQIIVTDVQPNAGGWWAGLNWPGYPVTMTDLSQVYLTARIKGTVGGPGKCSERYTLRIEDPQTDFLGFTMTADGTFQTVGGPLSSAVLGSTPDGDGVFDFLRAGATR